MENFSDERVESSQKHFSNREEEQREMGKNILLVAAYVVRNKTAGEDEVQKGTK
jgi:hypothetical protein